MINAHKGDHVLIAMPGAKLECVEVTHANRRYITAGINKFYRTTGNVVGGGDWKGFPYIVRKVAPDYVEYTCLVSALVAQ